jgi:bifunctional non-homologous end joining protein LigD
MLAVGGELPTGAGWAYEFKWDGVRALAVLEDGSLRWYARSGAEITGAYPELYGLASVLADAGVTDAVLDGEIVLLDDEGLPSFQLLSERIHLRDAGRARNLAANHPVTYMIFDVLSANGTDITGATYEQRRSFLESLAAGWPAWGRFVVPPRFEDAGATVDAAANLTLEGVVAKRLTSAYRPGLRSPDWVKIKHERTGDYVIGGWRVGNRALGALIVGTPGPAGLVYRGRVGGGISAATETDLMARLAPLRTGRCPFSEPLRRDIAIGATYVRPELVVEVRYGSITPDGKLRFPRFLRLRPDKTPAEVSDE